MEWYQQEVEGVLAALQTTANGLSGEEIGRRLQHYGPNQLQAEEQVKRFVIAVHQFKSPLIYILLIAALVTALLAEYVDTGVIMAVVILNGIIGYLQEFKAEESVRALKKMLVPRARVVRDGLEQEVDSSSLVPGDLVLLTSGNKVPADLRLMKTLQLRIDESMLTGESVPVDKLNAAISYDNLSPGDQLNMAFTGTTVVSGRARGIVVATGLQTALGRIAEEVREAAYVKVPLQMHLERFARRLAVVIVGMSLLVFLIGLFHGISLAEMFIVAVATAVSAIPEGLPVAVTIALAIGVARMAKRQAIVRKLPAVETLGSTTVIGSDKTGTLTRNEMTVNRLFAGGHVYEMTGSGYEPSGELLCDALPVDPLLAEHEPLRTLLRIGLLCNESQLYREAEQYKVDGDPTEGALIVAAMKAGLAVEAEQQRYPLVAMLPFESEYGYMATLHRQGEKKLLFLKGAPEIVLARCGADSVGDIFDRQAVLQTAERFAGLGLRVLAMAAKEVAPDLEEPTHAMVDGGFLFAGLQGMIDPPRMEVQEAVAGCRRAGIKTIMITGDHAVTAVAVAGKLGIGGPDPQVLTGKQLEKMDDDELFNRLESVSVFARVTPQHKLRITHQLLRHGEVVAVTGDGVNDAPALKAAHIGIAMGRTGTDVAKEAADMVLVDDNFASIFAAVEEGRVVYDNIRKVTLFLVSCGFGELVAILATSLLGLPIPYNPAQILWLNLVTNGLQDVALAFEPGEPGVLLRQPRRPTEGIISPLMIRRIVIMGLIMAAGTVLMFFTYLRLGMALEKARTVALTTMVFFQFYQAANCRSEEKSVFQLNPFGNPFLFYSLIAAFFAQLVVLYVPMFQWIFRTVPLTVGDMGLIILAATSIIVGVEMDKWRLNRRKNLV
ncbi:MAG: HAD-IC family P-type ATPase [Deltaproteobacteria bacterium]|nr:HAD-IC family P-type ATPase [Candidatus Anaeroferrophillus wilburensis]MBN2888064.1 HAD-IC family P-type ATPase [Deltaproteobacteria bacterium]